MWSTCKAGEHMCRLCDYDVLECRFVDDFVIKTLLELGKDSHIHTQQCQPHSEHWTYYSRGGFFDQKRNYSSAYRTRTHTVAATCIRTPYTCLIFINGLRCKRCYAICRRKQEERACHECRRRHIYAHARHMAKAHPAKCPSPTIQTTT